MADSHVGLLEDGQLMNEYKMLLGIDEEKILELIQQAFREARNFPLELGVSSSQEGTEVIFSEKAAEEIEEIRLKLKVSNEMSCHIIIKIMESYTKTRYEKVGSDLCKLLDGEHT